MPYHQAALAVEQLSALPHLPVLAAGLRGVQHTEAPGRVPSLVHRPEHGQLADPRLALKGEQLALGVSRIHLLAPAQPQRPGADQASQEHAGGARAPAVGRLPDSISFTCTTPPKRPSPRTGRQ